MNLRQAMVSAHSLDEMRGSKAVATVGVLFRTLEGAAAEDDSNLWLCHKLQDRPGVSTYLAINYRESDFVYT